MLGQILKELNFEFSDLLNEIIHGEKELGVCVDHYLDIRGRLAQ